jgi:hypothetical protein
MYSLM